MLNVARQFGYARITDDEGKDIAPALPAEPSRLAAIRDAVDTGYARFLAATPHWTFLQQTITVVVDPAGVTAIDGDTSRYLLPAGVAGRPHRSWLVTLPSGTWVGEALDTSISRVLAVAAERVNSLGPPVAAAVRPALNVTNGSTRWELAIAPRPDQAYNLVGEFRLEPVMMAELTDRHIAGPQHDQTIKDMSCAAMAESDSQFADAVERWQMQADRSLARSLENDGELQPSNLGTMPDTINLDGPTTRAGVRHLGIPPVTYGV